MPNPFLYIQTVFFYHSFRTIVFIFNSTKTFNDKNHQASSQKFRQLIQAVLFQTIQLSISTWFSFIRPIDRTLSCVTIPGQSGSDGNKTGTPHSPMLVISGHSLVRRSYPSGEKQSVYSTALAVWVNKLLAMELLKK